VSRLVLEGPPGLSPGEIGALNGTKRVGVFSDENSLRKGTLSAESIRGAGGPVICGDEAELGEMGPDCEVDICIPYGMWPLDPEVKDPYWGGRWAPLASPFSWRSFCL
jgi:hypothetical protein